MFLPNHTGLKMPISEASEKILEKYPELESTAHDLAAAIFSDARVDSYRSTREFLSTQASIRRLYIVKHLQRAIYDENIEAWMSHDLPRRKRGQKLKSKLINATVELTIARLEKKTRLKGLTV